MDKNDFIAWARKLQPTYRMSDATRAHLANVDLVAFVGPTGVGKTAISKRLNIPQVIGDVTRPVRDGEEPGRDYVFRQDYLEIIRDIKEGVYTQYVISGSNELYGTRAQSFPESGPCSMAVIARAMDVFRAMGFRSVKAFYVMPPSYTEWMKRLSAEGRDDLLSRLNEARESVSFAADHPDDFTFILNDNLELAVRDVEAVLSGGEVDAHLSLIHI